MMMESLQTQAGDRVLVLWHGGNSPDQLQQTVTALKNKVGDDGNVQVENIERLAMSKHPDSSFNTAVSGIVSPVSVVHSNELLSEIARILKPNGVLLLREPIVSTTDAQLHTKESLLSALQLAGYVNAQQCGDLQSLDINSDVNKCLKVTLPLSLIQLNAKKPEYEVGASSKLNFSWANKTAEKKSKDEVAKVWTLSSNDMMDDDLDIMDSEQLLDEDDLKKPDPASLRVCGTTGKRKACKDCSCGLAEELNNEALGNNKQQTKQQSVTSSCGSCYLGDAFRCASCPYLGMPAFKPGEKIQLTERQLKGDK